MWNPEISRQTSNTYYYITNVRELQKECISVIVGVAISSAWRQTKDKRELLQKPWNPYVRRHSALTEKSKYLKEHVLRQHSGWSARSQMHLKYLPYFGDESNSSILEEYGLIDKGEYMDILKPKQCTNCQEGNKPDARFCVKLFKSATKDCQKATK